MGKEENFGDKINSNGFDKNPDNINRKGRRISLKTEYARLSQDDRPVVWVLEEELEFRDNKGTPEVGLPLSPVQALLVKLNGIATNGKDADALNAIKFIWEQFDGKAKQYTEIDAKVDSSQRKGLVWAGEEE